MVVGGGIVGCATGYYLAKRGVKVTLVERNDLATGMTRAGLGGLGLRSELMKKSIGLYSGLSDELGCDLKFAWKGNLNFIVDESDIEVAAAEVQEMVSDGREAELLDRAEVRAMEPAVADDVIAATCSPDYGSVDAFKTTYEFGRGITRYGSQIILHSEVKDIGVERGAVTSVVTENGTIKTAAVVLATGIWAPELGARLGISIPVIPRRGHVLVTEGAPPLASDRCAYNQYGVYAELRRLGKKAAESDNPYVRQGVAWIMIPGTHDHYLIGSSRDFAGFDDSVRHDVIRALAERTGRFFPSFRDVVCIRAYCGFRQFSPDLKPIMGPVEKIKGLFIATGFEGQGIMLAPIIGSLMSELIAEGESSIPIHEFGLSRFHTRP